MAGIFGDFIDEKSVDSALKNASGSDTSKFKFDDLAMEQDFREEFEKYIKDLKKDAREKANGGIFRSQYSDDYNLGEFFRKRPWLLKEARSKWAWDTKAVTKGSFATGNGLFDEFMKTLKTDWWIDQAILMPFNLINVIDYQFKKNKNNKESDKYIAKLQMFGGDVKNLKDLSDPKVFQSACMAIRNQKGDKKKIQERLAVLYHVSVKHGGKNKVDLKLRKDIIHRATANVNLLKSFEKDADIIRKSVATNPALMANPEIANLMNKYNNTTGKFDFDASDLQKAVKNIEVLRKNYPYNNPEKYAEKLAEIHKKFGGDKRMLDKKLNEFMAEHKNIGSINKDKKGKEIKFEAPTINGIAPTGMEKVVYKNLSTTDAQKFMFNFEYMKDRFNIDGTESDPALKTADETDIANEKSILSAGGVLTPAQLLIKQNREARWEKNKKDRLFGEYQNTMTNLLGIADPSKVKQQIDFDKIKDISEKLEKKFREDLKNAPDMTSQEVKEKQLEIDMQIQIVKSLYNSFGLNNSYKKEKDADVKKQLEEQYKEQQEKIKGLDEFKKSFDKELKANRDLAKKDIDLGDVEFGLADKERKDYLRKTDKLNQKVRLDIAMITHPSNKVMDEDGNFDADTIKALQDDYSKINDSVVKEKEIVEKLLNAKPNQIKNLEKELAKTRKKVIDDLAKLKDASNDIVTELPNNDPKKIFKAEINPITGERTLTQKNHPLKFNVEKGRIDFKEERVKRQKALDKNKEKIDVNQKRVSDFKPIIEAFEKGKKDLLDENQDFLEQKILETDKDKKQRLADWIELNKIELEKKEMEANNPKSPFKRIKSAMDEANDRKKKALTEKKNVLDRI